MRETLFQSYLMGGFECSTHRNFTGKRLDLIAATRHDDFAAADYERLLSVGMKTARDGVRWHLVEREPYQYDFSSVANQVRAAEKTGIQIIWDLFHYGYPDDLDVFGADFPARFAGFAEAFIKFLSNEDRRAPFICPVNEISFYAWAAGQVGAFYPFEKERGDEMKRQLVLATIAAIDAIRAVCPEARFLQADPSVEVFPDTQEAKHIADAKNFRSAQFHATDMLVGKSEPEIGGGETYLDVVGINYYSQNQWRQPSGAKVLRGDADYRPFSEILLENFQRYNRPILIAETGIEDAARPEWFRYICKEVRIAESNGVPIEGICLYPIVNHPGWDDDRHCLNGLWDYPNEKGKREIYAPLAEEIKRQKRKFETPYQAAHN